MRFASAFQPASFHITSGREPFVEFGRGFFKFPSFFSCPNAHTSVQSHTETLRFATGVRRTTHSPATLLRIRLVYLSPRERPTRPFPAVGRSSIRCVLRRIRHPTEPGGVCAMRNH